MSDKQKYPINPDPDMNRIRSIVSYTITKMAEPMKDKSDGAEWAGRYGAVYNTLKIVAEELGIVGGVEA